MNSPSSTRRVHAARRLVLTGSRPDNRSHSWRIGLTAVALVISAAGVTAWSVTGGDGGDVVTGWFSGGNTGLERGEARVVRVVDGETLVVATADDPELKVRVLGIDTREVTKPDSAVECYGPDASEYVKDLLPAGTRIGLATDTIQPKTDRYGRALRHVFLIANNGKHQLLSLELIEAGYATKYTAARTDWDQILTTAETTAQQEQIGLWQACQPRAATR